MTGPAPEAAVEVTSMSPSTRSGPSVPPAAVMSTVAMAGPLIAAETNETEPCPASMSSDPPPAGAERLPSAASPPEVLMVRLPGGAISTAEERKSAPFRSRLTTPGTISWPTVRSPAE